MATINIKRIYKPAEKTDGFRVLVDRLWPRGISKEAAHLDLWLKEIAPPTELRQWFHSSDADDRWDEFKARYLMELHENDVVSQLADLANDNETVTLLYAVPDENHNHALILKEFIEKLN
jgi:uncharacterized protein YeaO (DUF488 family)